MQLGKEYANIVNATILNEKYPDSSRGVPPFIMCLQNYFFDVNPPLPNRCGGKKFFCCLSFCKKKKSVTGLPNDGSALKEPSL